MKLSRIALMSPCHNHCRFAGRGRRGPGGACGRRGRGRHGGGREVTGRIRRPGPPDSVPGGQAGDAAGIPGVG
eukprot:scaffold26322_cov30-Prasinocladus_malaysianus.AAC.1